MENEKIQCACGCGGLLDKYDQRGRPRRFILGHQKYWLGKKRSEETKRKISASHSRRPKKKRESELIECACGCGTLIEKFAPWGIRRFVRGHHRLSAEARKKIRQHNLEHPRRYWLGKTFSEEHKSRLSESHKGIPLSPYAKAVAIETLRKHQKTGADHPHWKGGVTSENRKIRKSRKYKEWRRQVFERDNYTCQHCQIRGKYLHPHHIKPFALYPELRFDIENGVTLCKECHKKVHRKQK